VLTFRNGVRGAAITVIVVDDAGLLVIALYTLVPAGQPRNRLKWVVAGVFLLSLA
jgi:hypothetical protein